MNRVHNFVKFLYIYTIVIEDINSVHFNYSLFFLHFVLRQHENQQNLKNHQQVSIKENTFPNRPKRLPFQQIEINHAVSANRVHLHKLLQDRSKLVSFVPSHQDTSGEQLFLSKYRHKLVEETSKVAKIKPVPQRQKR